MRKTDKKMDNELRIALTNVCETALTDIDGFQWLTHTVNYSSFPQSLKITCVFDTNAQLAAFSESNEQDKLVSLIQSTLNNLGIPVKNMARHVFFDSEESCMNVHDGNWAKRLV
ncbi:Fis family transcriptional regulator [Enterovibrio norvegicus]|uniref:hypothetical protein n=1 Tax=Enterovibrio norvegicus TaxID=188144 RepID=UPI0002F7EB07|nr:hypothetical protein [Enterovibrio norvegicus]OEF54634.1 Fis family transcriptional regulator [Enterovibrio norvegicus]